MINFMVADPKTRPGMEGSAKFQSQKKLNETTSSFQSFNASSNKSGNAYKSFKTETSSSNDLCLPNQNNVVHNLNLPEGIFQKFCNGFSSRFLRKPFDYGGHGETKYILVNSLDSPLYYDASRFLKKQLNKFYPLSRRSAHNSTELEILSNESIEEGKYETADEFQVHTSQTETIQHHLQCLTNDQVRAKVVAELMNSERDFVRILTNVKETYLLECRMCNHLFTTDDICKIFGNWEQICELQTRFLNHLENRYAQKTPHRMCVGDSFLTFKEEFTVYSDYCNNHPLAITTLQQLNDKIEYKIFFENVRVKNRLAAISLDGFLLTPIQRICKYPLQLAELLKYTEVSHPDYDFVKKALLTMREVTIAVNERKRRMESLEKLILWQQQVDGWEGSNLVEHSSQLIHQSDMSRVFTGLWFTDVSVFLFDHQLIFCKKYQDHSKNEFLVYRGRVPLTYCEIIDIPEGKDTLLGISVRYGIKIQNMVENKWLLLCCRNHKEKIEWLESFRNERELVLRDKRNKLEFTAKDKYLANVIAATCHYDRVWSSYEDKVSKKSISLYRRKINYRK